MIKPKKGLKVVALALAALFMTIGSFRVDASAAVGASSKSSYSPDKQSATSSASSATAALVAGFEVGFVVGAVVGTLAGVAYGLVTNYIGQEEIASLSLLNYDPQDLSHFDNINN